MTSTTSTSDLHPLLKEAVTSLGIASRLRALPQAAVLSGRFIEEARRQLAAAVPGMEPLDVIVCGSIARREMSTESDFDWLVVAHGLPSDVRITRRLLEATDGLRSTILSQLISSTGEAAEIRQPGASGLFGTLISAVDVTERIGLEQDTNTSQTRRLLILEEGASIYRPKLYEQLLRAILQRYLIDYSTPKPGVPRFLLNDIIKYWRTISVDYQAKRWHPGPPEWGLRYLKLILSRKLSYAGTLCSLFLCEKADEEYFVNQFAMPPLARLAQILPRLDSARRDDLAAVLLAADAFAEALSDPAFRSEMKSIATREGQSEGTTFEKWRKRASELQGCLERLFFEGDDDSRSVRVGIWRFEEVQ